MRERGYSPASIVQYRYFLVRTADWLALRGRRLISITRQEIPGLGQAIIPEPTYSAYNAALHRWLKFRQCFTVLPSEPWGFWLGDFALS